jgi:hypothetical protein
MLASLGAGLAVDCNVWIQPHRWSVSLMASQSFGRSESASAKEKNSQVNSELRMYGTIIIYKHVIFLPSKVTLIQHLHRRVACPCSFFLLLRLAFDAS